MCIIKGKEHCKRLNEQHNDEFKEYRVLEDDTIYIGYVNSLGLLYVPFGDIIEVYGEDEYCKLSETL